MSAKLTDMKGKNTAATIVAMNDKTRRRDDDLARYMAYRCHVWKEERSGRMWKELAQLMGVEPPEVTSLKDGNNGSRIMVERLAGLLGPTESQFKELARAWAEAYPNWNPKEDQLPSVITHTGDPLQDGQPGGRSVYSDEFRRAVRALMAGAQCTMEQGKLAAEKAWADQRGGDATYDWQKWFYALVPALDSIKRSSGERPSVKDQKAADPAE